MKNSHLIFGTILLVILIVLFESPLSVGCNKSLILFCLCVCAFDTFIILNNIKDYYVRPVFLFLICFWIVNCQLYLDVLVGLITPDYSVFCSPSLINKGCLLSAIAFTALLMGYIFANDYTKQTTNSAVFKKNIERKFTYFQVLAFFVWLLSLSSADISGASYASSGAYDRGNSFTGYVEIFFTAAMIISLSYNMRKESNVNSIVSFIKNLPIGVTLTAAGYIIIRIFSGDRGPAIDTSIIFFFAFLFKTRKRIKIVYFIAALVIGSIIVTSIGLTRVDNFNMSMSERLTYSIHNKEDFNSSSLSPNTVELANSVICTHVALQAIESGHPYMYGLFHICYIVKFVPFLGNYFVHNILSLPSIYQSSSEFVTVTEKGKYYQSGMGTTTIADNYLEFGAIGVILGLFIIGFILKKVDTCLLFSNIESTSIGMILFVFAICHGTFYIPRGIFTMYIREWVYSYVALKFILLLTRGRNEQI